MDAFFRKLQDQVLLNAKKAEAAKDAKFEVKLESRKTVPKPFNLAESRPKPLPVDTPVPPRPAIKPPPPRSEGPTKEQLAIEAAKCDPGH